MARPHIEPFCDRDEHFKPMRLLGFGTGMHYKMLSMDTDTGACSMTCLLYTSPSPRDYAASRMPSSA